MLVNAAACHYLHAKTKTLFHYFADIIQQNETYQNIYERLYSIPYVEYENTEDSIQNHSIDAMAVMRYVCMWRAEIVHPSCTASLEVVP